MKRIAPALLSTLLVGCATPAGKSAPQTAAIQAQPANARVRIYTDCVRVAIEAGAVDRYGRYVRFSCAGPAAQALFDAMEAFARTRGWDEVSTDGAVRTRYISEDRWDDRCWRTEPTTYGCIIHLGVGAFLDAEQDAASKPIPLR